MDGIAFLASASAHCERNGAKLTALRRQILDLVLQHDGVVKAYEILSELQQVRGSAAPPTVYRALDFLVEQGILHRVEALNGFVVCQHLDSLGHHAHSNVLLSCRACGRLDELEVSNALADLGEMCLDSGFVMMPQQLLLQGHCVGCQATGMLVEGARCEHTDALQNDDVLI